MDQYAVFGNPIAQSKSPVIHQMFAEQTGQQIQYQAILAPTDGFTSSLESFFADSCAKGCNITMPFKEEAAAWVDKLSEGAQLAGAVNTIIRNDDGTFKGDNTDGEGLVLDLLRQGAELKNANILLLGAGGAARGVISPLLAYEPNSILVVNRTAEKAHALAELVPDGNVSACGFDSLPQGHKKFDVIINSTSTSLSGGLPPLSDYVYKGASFAYDMVYANQPTPFMSHASKMGVIKTSDGLGMLVGQAARSFYLWRGVKPDIKPVLNKLRAEL